MEVQKENGYTSTANAIMEKFAAFRIPGEVRQVIDAIMRKTYGWNKKEDEISNSQLITMTKMIKGNVSRSLSKAITHKIVIKSDNKLSLNKNITEWVSFTKKVIKSETKVIKSDNKKLSKVRDTKEKERHYTKETTIVGENLPINELIGMFKEVNPSYKQLYPNKGQRLALERMVNEHGLDRIEQAIKVLPMVVGKPFAPTITTPFELERKMGSLLAYMKREHMDEVKNSVTKV